MTQHLTEKQFRTVGDGSGLAQEERFYQEDVQLALRNRGMHYLLVHFDIPAVDDQGWRLRVGGLVSNSMRLTLEEIKKRPSTALAVTMECAGNGRALVTPRAISQPWLVEAVGTAEWTGTPLRGLLEEAGVSDKAVDILFTGLDQGIQGGKLHYYQRSLNIDEAVREEVLVAYQMNGEPLQPQHGYPLRLIVPGWYGMTSVKWLDRIEAIGEPFQGYQMIEAYRYSQWEGETGDPVMLIKVRALMVPHGVPDFLTRTRLVEAGPVTLSGKAWAGRSGISRVEVSTDGGSTWSDARLEEEVSPYAWRGWSFDWAAVPGSYTLCVRAADTAGNVQPVTQPWNYQGMGNNMVQRVDAVVE